MNKNIMPLLLTAIDVVQCVICICHKDTPRAIYWIAAAALTVSTIYMK